MVNKMKCAYCKNAYKAIIYAVPKEPPKDAKDLILDDYHAQGICMKCNNKTDYAYKIIGTGLRSVIVTTTTRRLPEDFVQCEYGNRKTQSEVTNLWLKYNDGES